MALQRSSRFNIEFFGNPAASNRIKTLATDPFYLFSSDHPLALMLPEALNTTEYGSKIGIAIRDMNFIVLAGVALDSEVANGGTHFVIDPGRLTKLFSDLDAQGAQLDPIQGDATFAMPRAHSILSYFIAKMPIDDRTSSRRTTSSTTAPQTMRALARASTGSRRSSSSPAKATSVTCCSASLC
jgi:hypothetical protein